MADITTQPENVTLPPSLQSASSTTDSSSAATSAPDVSTPSTNTGAVSTVAGSDGTAPVVNVLPAVQPAPPSNALHPKVAAGLIAGAVVTVLVFVLSVYNINVPNSVSDSAVVLITFLAGFITSSH